MEMICYLGLNICPNLCLMYKDYFFRHFLLYLIIFNIGGDNFKSLEMFFCETIFPKLFFA